MGLWDDCDLCSGRVPQGDGSASRWSPSSYLQKRTSDLALSNDEDYDQGHQVSGAGPQHLNLNNFIFDLILVTYTNTVNADV